MIHVHFQEEIYGYELKEKLHNYGFHSFSEGTIYPLLLRMQKEGLVTSVLRESTTGPKRKYYALSKMGEKELDKFKERWDDLKLFVENVINKEGKQNYMQEVCSIFNRTQNAVIVTKSHHIKKENYTFRNKLIGY